MTGTNSVTEEIKKEFRHRWDMWLIILIVAISGMIGGFTIATYYVTARAASEIAGIRAAYAEASAARLEQLGQCLRITEKNGAAASNAASSAADAASNAASAAKDAAKALDKVTGEIPK